jgi:hypothetical protein
MERHLKHYRDVILGVPPWTEVGRRPNHTPTFRVFFILISNDVRQHRFHVGLEIGVIIIVLRPAGRR